MKRSAAILLCTVVLALIGPGGFPYVPAQAQDPGANTDIPDIPSIDEIKHDQDTTQAIPPSDYTFRIGVVAEVERNDLKSTDSRRRLIKTPLILYNPNTGSGQFYAENFPARIVANSDNGQWVVGIVPSTAIEGSSGSKYNEVSVSLNMQEGGYQLIQEFPLYSKFQAVFSPTDNNVIYYCTNEPAAENRVNRLNLRKMTDDVLPIKGNRHYLYGMKPAKPMGIWVEDPYNVLDYPVLNLVDIANGQIKKQVQFPGSTAVMAKPDGTALLAVVEHNAEASLGWYDLNEDSYNQVPNLVLTQPTIKWTHDSMAVIAKETTTTSDRFIWIDLESGAVREIHSGYFKVSYWDISPKDEALVFITESQENPILYVVPLDPLKTTITRMPLTQISKVTWLGCLYPPKSGGSWWDNLLPF